MKRFCLFILTCVAGVGAYSQQQSFFFNEANGWPPYVTLEEITIPSFPAFHSSVVGAHDGKWLIMGGRTNGLHGFYPPFAFPTNGMQNQIYVVDPQAGSVWSSNLDSLPQALKEQLSSSNMQHSAIGDKLYITGGYGYSATQDEYITFPYITEVDMPSLSQAVIAGTSPASAFKYKVDSNMAVTGGRMLSLNNRLYLFFGHVFTGRYSTTPGDVFEQEYTYQIRMFDIGSSIDSVAVANYSTVTDSIHFRRRDLNVTPYVRKASSGNDTVGFMAWSGVFKADEDRPHTNQIFIKPDGSYAIIEHEQKYNQYHSATVPIKPLFGNPAAVLFVGGMAENQLGVLTPDTLVPFVKNISMVYENSPFFHEETSFDSLSGYWGTNAEFIPVTEFLNSQTGLIELQNQVCLTPQTVGYIVGGIESTGRHISSSNDPSLSFASSKVYKVSISLVCENVNEYNVSSISVFPNPSQDFIRAQTDENIIRWQVVDISGKLMIEQKTNGINSLDISTLNKGTYFVKIFTEGNLYRSTFIKI